MRDNEFTKILGWPGYRVYRQEIDEAAKTLRLWVRRKQGNRKLICSGCGRKFSDAHDSREREVRDLPWGEYRTTVIIEVYRVCCPQCGVRVEKVPQLPSKAPFSKRFEEAVGLACESASVRQVARQFRLAASTVRAIDLRYLQRWSATRRKAPLAHMGVDEIYFGKQMKFITVVSNLETGEPLWFGQDRKQETLQLRWQRLVPFQNLGFMLLDHLEGILNYCRTKVRFGVVEAINGNIKTLLRRGRGYKNLGYLLLKAQRMAVTKTEFIVLQKVA
jgi:transposase